MPASVCKLQRDVFEDVAQVGAVAQALKEAAALADAATVLDHAGHPAHQAIVEAGKFGGGLVQVAQIDPRFQHGEVGPNVRPPKRQHLAEFHSRLSLNDVVSPAEAAVDRAFLKRSTLQTVKWLYRQVLPTR